MVSIHNWPTWHQLSKFNIDEKYDVTKRLPMPYLLAFFYNMSQTDSPIVRQYPYYVVLPYGSNYKQRLHGVTNECCHDCGDRWLNDASPHFRDHIWEAMGMEEDQNLCNKCAAKRLFINCGWNTRHEWHP